MDFVLEQMGEEALRQVLGVVDGIATTADISIKRRPVGLAKPGQRGARDFRFRLRFARCNNHAPVGRGEGISLAVNRSRRVLHAQILSTESGNAKQRKNTISCSSVRRSRLETETISRFL